MFGTDGIFLITKCFAGFVNIPIVALFAVGLIKCGYFFLCFQLKLVNNQGKI